MNSKPRKGGKDMKYTLILAALILFTVFVPGTPHIGADWQAAIKGNSAELRLVLYVAER
jgi:hypothetical protein